MSRAKLSNLLLDSFGNRLFTFGVAAVAYNIGGMRFPFAVGAAILAARLGCTVATWMDALHACVHIRLSSGWTITSRIGFAGVHRTVPSACFVRSEGLSLAVPRIPHLASSGGCHAASCQPTDPASSAIPRRHQIRPWPWRIHSAPGNSG